MTIKELIKQLQELDQDSNVYFEYEYYYENVPYRTSELVTGISTGGTLYSS